MTWYDPSWLYRQKITIDHTLVADDLTDFPALITDAVVQASLFTHARSDGADVVVIAADETTRLKRELVTYDAMAGALELYVRIPSLSSVTDTVIYLYYGNAAAPPSAARRATFNGSGEGAPPARRSPPVFGRVRLPDPNRTGDDDDRRQDGAARADREGRRC